MPSGGSRSAHVVRQCTFDKEARGQGKRPTRPRKRQKKAMLANHDVALPSRYQDPEAKSLFDLFLDSRRCHGRRPALWVEGSVFTYDELYQATARLAGAIRMGRGQKDQGEGGQCGLLVNRTPTAYAAVLASLMVGSAYVPLNPQFPRDRLRDTLLSSAVDTLIVDRRSAAAAGPLLESVSRPLTVLLPDAAGPEWPLRGSCHRYLARADIGRAPPAAPISDHSRENGAYLLFTSGSTGKPKGVLISNANALAYIENARRRYRPGPDDRFSQLFDFSFDLSVHDMFLAWSCGACLYCPPEGKLIGLSDFIRRCQLTFWFSVPSTAAFMRQLRMLKPGSYPSLRWSLFCGEALPMGLAASWQEAATNSTVENLYGPTEATVAFTAYRLPKESRAELNALPTVPIGMPLSGQRVMVTDDRGEPLADGQAGELFLGGPQVAAGYWHAPDQTAARFQPPRHANGEATRWYRTGDRVIMSSEHGLIFLGRVDRQAKIRGHRVELMEVEHSMRLAAGTDTVAAIPWPIGDDGLALGVVGFVAGSQKIAAEIIEACRARLPDYMVPGQIHCIRNWPLNGNGKTDYISLTGLLNNDDVGNK
jgi:D-alanine--poly(phosphoribitol) ligase subunit 1